MWTSGPRHLLLAFTALLWARGAAAGDVEVTPFGGFQFSGYGVSGGYGGSPASAGTTLGTGFYFGATADMAVTPGWRVGLLYSRQQDTGFAVERYLVSVQEGRGEERNRFFGVGLIGATRFDPRRPGSGSLARFTVGMGLGGLTYLTPRLALRAEARGFFVDSPSSGTLLCNGGCVFLFSAYGVWQGDLSAGITLRF